MSKAKALKAKLLHPEKRTRSPTLKETTGTIKLGTIDYDILIEGSWRVFVMGTSNTEPQNYGRNVIGIYLPEQVCS